METQITTLAWKRGVWLTVLFGTALFTASVLRYYETLLKNWAWLTAFIPLVMSSGGNSGNQSATLIITALSSGNIKTSDWRKILWRELRVGLLLGSLLAGIGVLVSAAMTWSDSAAMSHRFWPLVVPITLVLVVTCGAVAGSVLPLIFKGLGLDPALMSNPFVAALSDILAIIIYISVSILLLNKLPAAGS
jgi:magnesium transporter